LTDRCGIYVHVPFCERKCPYCDFYSVEGTGLKDRFLGALQKDIAGASRRVPAAVVDTVYLGGGTPSLLTQEEIGGILSGIGGHFDVAADAELTIEVNPGTTTRESLRLLRQLGINRLSVGVQSFDDRILSFLGRIHSAAEARACVRDARAAGFENLSVDLIFAVPGQLRGQWVETVKETLVFNPEHVSAYSLIVEEQTPLWERVQAGEVVPVDEDEEAAQYTATMELFEEAGYDHYEVSNYARKGCRSRHNAGYWHHCNYLGFGPSAHSFWVDPCSGSARRWANVRQVGGYCDLLWREESPVVMAEELGTRELVNERIFLGLRSDGLSLTDVAVDLGYEFSADQQAYIDRLLACGHAVLSDGTVRLTRQGYLLCDEICSQLMIS
jgi:oxygen-independent coproporphyrinogen-3 oxidase